MRTRYSWSHRVEQILLAVDALACAELQRSDIELIFGIQRRAALRLMEKLAPDVLPAGDWQIDRDRLREWLAEIRAESLRDASRSDGVFRAVSQAELEKKALRAELAKRKQDDLPTWTVDPAVFTHRVQDLPANIHLSAGAVAIIFSEENPSAGAQLLHELSLAMLSDWRGFCSNVGTTPKQSTEETIETMLRDLELDRVGGLA
jgi:hypothetical protein